MSALRYLAPQFLEEGRLCWLRSPLYVVQNGSKNSYYFTDEEFALARGKIKGEVKRAKGLGGLNAEEAHESMFTNEYQRIDILYPDPDSNFLLENLMGSDVEPRRDFIFNNIDFSTVRE